MQNVRLIWTLLWLPLTLGLMWVGLMFYAAVQTAVLAILTKR